MLNYNKIIFVSTDNTCLSPLAVAIMEREMNNKNLIIESRGIVVLFPEPVNQKAIAIAKSKGLCIDEHKSKQLESSDFGEDILVLVMNKQQKQKIYEEFKDALNVYTLKEFVGEVGDLKTPYGGDLADYGEIYKALERLVIKVKDKILGVEEE
jgi:protein-tyrosine-phosphatase